MQGVQRPGRMGRAGRQIPSCGSSVKRGRRGNLSWGVVGPGELRRAGAPRTTPYLPLHHPPCVILTGRPGGQGGPHGGADWPPSRARRPGQRADPSTTWRLMPYRRRPSLHRTYNLARPTPVRPPRGGIAMAWLAIAADQQPTSSTPTGLVAVRASPSVPHVTFHVSPGEHPAQRPLTLRRDRLSPAVRPDSSLHTG
ncbi:hypothetical protein CC78DRAFT_76631 [Lojkania enalia]|uniref:Uncharacterized protein n=1 Tax=Lojkania enalia TaxID=147567 RepID=A0A9P4KIW6_9PLEO|nr:hypothetical protein CC78DRAFT_76631 [Didymosphaeria enalia]